MRLNGDDRRNGAQATAQAAAERLAAVIARDIALLIKTNHPNVHPSVVAQGLVNAQAGMIVIFSNSAEQANNAVTVANNTLRRTVVGQWNRRVQRAAGQ